MNLYESIFNDLKIKYIITNKNNDIKESNITENELKLIIKTLIKSKNNFYQYDNRIFKCSKFEHKENIIYYIQDITSIEKKYHDLKLDYLTKLYTRAVALPLIDNYIMHSINYNEDFSVIMGDIDFFKKINDTYGHDEGDKVLIDISNILLNSFRIKNNLNDLKKIDLRDKEKIKQTDVICRYGGEEFLILLKNISLENTLKRIDEVKNKIEKEGIVTMSFGITNVTHDFLLNLFYLDSVEEIRNKLIKLSDQCLYNSKQNGRNLISYYENEKIKVYKKNY